MSTPFDTSHRPKIGVAERLAEDIEVITAPNAGPMTFTGTRTYLVGSGPEVALIDPGPHDEAHLNSILQALGTKRKIQSIVLTHRHIDHTALVPDLKRMTGAQVYGYNSYPDRFPKTAGGEGIDHGFVADITVSDGETISGDGWHLDVVHTPGHLADHMALATNGRLFSGDHVMGWATTLISPPSGDLTEFMASLEKLLARDETVFFPGHGAPITDPKRIMHHIRDHRLMREAQIVAALTEGPATADALTASIYMDVSPELHAAAKRNVFAHLIALERAGRANSDGKVFDTATFSIG